MEKGVQILLGVLIVAIIIVGSSLLIWPNPSTGMQQSTGHAVNTQTKDPIRIGITLPLTGEAASFGIGGMAGLNLALKEINEAGGVNGRPIVMCLKMMVVILKMALLL